MQAPSQSTVKLLRDSAMFLLGLVGAIREIFLVTQHDPVLIAFLGGLMGLPAFLRRDERNSWDEDDQKRKHKKKDREDRDLEHLIVDEIEGGA